MTILLIICFIFLFFSLMADAIGFTLFSIFLILLFSGISCIESINMHVNGSVKSTTKEIECPSWVDRNEPDHMKQHCK